MPYSFRAFRLFRDLYLIPKRIMRKFKENNAVKRLQKVMLALILSSAGIIDKSQLCRQTIRKMSSNYLRL